MQELTNTGDNKLFDSPADLFSKRSGFAPVVMPNGLLTGAQVKPKVGQNDQVEISSATANQGGVKKTIAGTTLTVARAAVDTHIIASIVINSAGAFEAIAGAEGTSFSETRGAAGGPAYIEVDEIEVAQIRLASGAAAEIQTAEVFTVPGLHREMALSPVLKVLASTGQVEFAGQLPTIHTGDTPKKVYASFAEPIFAAVDLAADFQPSENTHSLSSTQVYGGTIGSTSISLNSATFKAYLEDGISDPLAKLRDEILWFKFMPDRHKLNQILEQGILGIRRSYPAGGKVEADCTISPEQIGISVEG
jgi:hypothetical protein